MTDLVAAVFITGEDCHVILILASVGSIRPCVA